MKPADRSDETDARALSRRIARGDPEAFAAFYEAYFDFAYSAARRLTRRDESFCLDVVQDAMLRVVRSMPPLETRAEVRAWFARVVHSTALDALRSEARRERRERASAESSPAHRSARSVEERAELEERIRWLEAQLRELGPADRVLLERRFRGGGTLERLGEEVGLSGHAVHGRIRRLLEKLRASARRWSGDAL